jgi:chromosome segregation ATPase
MVKKLENKNSGSLDAFKKEMKRFMEILIEKVDDRISLIAEQYLDFDKKFKKIDERLKNIEEILQQHSITLVEHSRILGEHSRILGEHSRILGEHSRILGEHGKILTEIQNQIRVVHSDLKQKVDYREFQNLQKRVDFLEQKVLQLSRSK